MRARNVKQDANSLDQGDRVQRLRCVFMVMRLATSNTLQQTSIRHSDRTTGLCYGILVV